MEQTISIQEFLKIIKKRLFLIISLIILFAGTAAGYSYFYLPPIYQAQTQILVNQKSSEPNGYSWSVMETDLQLIKTYNVIMKSPAVLDKVTEELDLKLTTKELSRKISLSNEDESKVVNISVEDEDPKQAVIIANKVAEVFKEEIPSLMSVDNVSILSVARLEENQSPIKPNKTFNTAVAGIAGLFMGIGITILLEFFNTKIRNEKDIEEDINLPVMGIISPISPKIINKSNSYLERRKRLE